MNILTLVQRQIQAKGSLAQEDWVCEQWELSLHLLCLEGGIIEGQSEERGYTY